MLIAWPRNREALGDHWQQVLKHLSMSTTATAMSLGKKALPEEAHVKHCAEGIVCAFIHPSPMLFPHKRQALHFFLKAVLKLVLTQATRQKQGSIAPGQIAPRQCSCKLALG
eukprot:1156350-Pelagomonas_calceolata.AAC.26